MKKQRKNIIQTVRELFRSDRQAKEISIQEALNRPSSTLLIDVRSKQEYQEGHLNGAICIPDYEIVAEAPKIIPDKNKAIILYCQSGARSKKATEMLENMGYSNVVNVAGGLNQ